MTDPENRGVQPGWTSRLCLGLHSLAHWLHVRRLRPLGAIVQLANRLLTGADIDPMAQVSRAAIMPHTIGIVVGETAIVESGAILMPHVVLGATTSWLEGRRHPYVKRGACIGAGAVLLGPIVIGERATVGANAVVVDNVPDGATVVGIPARLSAA